MTQGDLRRAAATAVRSWKDPEHIRGSLRYRTSPKWAFVDVDRRLDHAVLLTASGRSGSTWLMEALNHDNRYRVVFEPFREEEVPAAAGVPFRYLPADDPAPAEHELFASILTGRLRSRWSDSQNHRRVATRRLVKAIRVSTMLPWISTQFPQVPMIHLLRHPIAVAESRVMLNFDPELLVNWWTTAPFTQDPTFPTGPLARFADLIAEVEASQDWLHKFVLRWCLENYVAIVQAKAHRASFAFYEDLLTDPAGELRRLLAHLGRPWEPGILEHLDVPSSHANPRRAGEDREKKLASWCTNLDLSVRKELLSIVETFGLDFVYGAEPRPLLPADDVRR